MDDALISQIATSQLRCQFGTSSFRPLLSPMTYSPHHHAVNDHGRAEADEEGVAGDAAGL